MSITDFEDWTFALDLENFEEIDSLYQSVKHISDYGMYRTVEGRMPGTYIVTASFMDDSLFLDSENARSAYLHYIGVTRTCPLSYSVATDNKAHRSHQL